MCHVLLAACSENSETITSWGLFQIFTVQHSPGITMLYGSMQSLVNILCVSVIDAFGLKL
jgi:hypothetical protein